MSLQHGTSLKYDPSTTRPPQPPLHPQHHPSTQLVFRMKKTPHARRQTHHDLLSSCPLRGGRKGRRHSGLPVSWKLAHFFFGEAGFLAAGFLAAGFLAAGFLAATAAFVLGAGAAFLAIYGWAMARGMHHGMADREREIRWTLTWAPKGV